MAGGSAKDAAGAADGSPRHIPVLMDEVLAAVEPAVAAAQAEGRRAVIVDGTFGAGGYSRAFLDRFGASPAGTHVFGIDQDPSAGETGAALSRSFEPTGRVTGDQGAARFTFISGNFRHLDHLVREAGAADVDAVVLDVGVSSMQLDEAARGFSFLNDGPLDMRMAQSGMSASDVVNTFEPARLVSILKTYGEERRARAIVRAMEKARSEALIETTAALADLVRSAIGQRPGDDKHPATRTFQALRIYVNDELRALADGLCAAERLLRPGGRLAVVSFHSLEDRIVKRFLRMRAGKEPRASRHLPEAAPVATPSFRIVNPRPLHPGNQELARNPRARSAILRIAERTEGAARPCDHRALGVPVLNDAP